MNEVMRLAEDLGIQIYYQDTDSIHIPRDNVERMVDAFKTKYNRDLIGNQLGQFYNELPGTNPNRSEVYAVESYFIWKKAYIDKLSSDHYHIHLEGIPLASIQLEINKNFNGDAMSLYKRLFEGGSVAFDLLKLGFDST